MGAERDCSLALSNSLLRLIRKDSLVHPIDRESDHYPYFEVARHAHCLPDALDLQDC